MLARFLRTSTQRSSLTTVSVRFISEAPKAANTFDVSSIPLPNEDANLLGKQGKKNAAAKKAEEDAVQEVRSNVNAVTGEINGPKGPEPTRFGDYEKNGRCYDF